MSGRLPLTVSRSSPRSACVEPGIQHRAPVQLSNTVSQVLARPSEWLELFKASRKRDAFFLSYGDTTKFALPRVSLSVSNQQWPGFYAYHQRQCVQGIERCCDRPAFNFAVVRHPAASTRSECEKSGCSVANFRLLAVCGNTHQLPSSCLKKNSVCVPDCDAVSMHTYRRPPNLVRLKTVTRTGVAGVGASHFST